jgi:hypothetical protein
MVNNNKNENNSSSSSVAVIIPYRNRLKNLKIFLIYIHQFLMKQKQKYKIYLVEPIESNGFNRALLLNIGFLEAKKDYNWDCFIFHDVDLLPEIDSNIYKCDNEYPKQFAISVSSYSYS